MTKLCCMHCGGDIDAQSEIERRDRQLKEATDHEVAYQTEIEQLRRDLRNARATIEGLIQALKDADAEARSAVLPESHYRAFSYDQLVQMCQTADTANWQAREQIERLTKERDTARRVLELALEQQRDQTVEIERRDRRIRKLEHELRRASHRFNWLADYHLNAEYSKSEARKLADEMWQTQANEGEPTLKCLVSGCGDPVLVAEDGAVGALCEDHHGKIIRHTTEDNFQHFLSYSGKRGVPHEADLRLAYHAGADVEPPAMCSYVGAPQGSPIQCTLPAGHPPGQHSHGEKWSALPTCEHGNVPLLCSKCADR